MNFDIVSKLFPDLTTMLVQLGATFVIYLLYKKYLHTPVLAYLDQRREVIADELSTASKLKEEALLIKQQSQDEYKELYVEIAELKDKLLADAKKEHEAQLIASNQEIAQLRAANAKAMEAERSSMINELYSELLEVATSINQRVLEDASFDEDEMLKALQKEIEQHEYQH
ncbi:MAG: ATP synthase F0 subunit B [Erysipelothrix sp.]|nr:ATP synthase F0 subunit B [Erysipelothrix sp.]